MQVNSTQTNHYSACTAETHATHAIYAHQAAASFHADVHSNLSSLLPANTSTVDNVYTHR